MSMISAQCDELQAMAESVGLEVPQAATLMMGAADAIDRLDAENAKLRELVRHLRECTRHNVCAACAYADDACDFDYDMRELGVDDG